MSYHKRVNFADTFCVGKSKGIYTCIRCEKPISPNDDRVKSKRTPYFCFHAECFEEEYGFKFESPNDNHEAEEPKEKL